jgi:hypothetical protein
MLIEFKIQLDGGATPTVTQAEAVANPDLPTQKQLGAAYTKPASVLHSAAQTRPGGSAPIGDPGTGQPTAIASSSGSGTVFVVGPIVVFGSGGERTGPGGSAPIGDPGTGKPGS